MLAYCANTHFSPRCQYAAGFTYFICSNILIFLFLFLNFYSKSYKKKGLKKEIEDDYVKNHNGVKTNGVCKNGVLKDVKENGSKADTNVDTNILDDIPYEVEMGGGDYIKDGKRYITRRTAKAAYGAEYDFDSLTNKWSPDSHSKVSLRLIFCDDGIRWLEC